MTPKITAALLYDLIQCPHRPTMDLFGDRANRDKVNAFVQLLWEKGSAFELEVIEGLEQPILNLTRYAGEEKERETLEAMQRGEPLIYSARITAGDLLGDPDLLRYEDGGYVAGDIKSGSGEYGDGDDAQLKKHYGVQLSLYTDILEQQGFASSRRPFVWDIHGAEIVYNLDEVQGKRNSWTMWQVYQETLKRARGIVARTEVTAPAYGGVCKLCHWYTACIADLEGSDDLTLLPELGRAKRDVMSDRISTISELASADVEVFITGKRSDFRGIGPDTLRKFHDRANLTKTKDARPCLTAPLHFPHSQTELFFDIEVDPMRDHCYLHGFIERRDGDVSSEKYRPFFTDDVTAEEEERAFADAWQYICENQPCVIYYYSKYERTIWRKLQAKYPTVCSENDIEALFDPSQSIDLYFDVVRKATEWPTRDHSIKTLANFLGFKWRDTDPSGAASIEWFDRWTRTGDYTIKQRILDYNEDDCIATRVVLDGIRAL